MNPDPNDESSVWLEAVNEARKAELSGDWVRAEQAFLRAVDEPSGSPELRSKACLDLAEVYSVLGRTAEQKHALDAAVAIANQSEMVMIVLMALQRRALFFLSQHELDEARRDAQECFSLMKVDRDQNLWARYAQGASLIFDTRAILILARCAVEEHKPKEAEKLLAKARKRAGAPENLQSTAAGILAVESQYWHVTAKLHEQNGDLDAACEALKNLVDYRRAISLAPQLDGAMHFLYLAEALEAYAAMLTRAGKAARATPAQSEANTIRTRYAAPK
ncbi:MAG: hypothetical protein WCL39_10110 [Armatimonadota bacterium]